MSLTSSLSLRRPPLRHAARSRPFLPRLLATASTLCLAAVSLPAQAPAPSAAQLRAQRFAASRTLPSGAAAASALSQARAGNSALAPSIQPLARARSLTASPRVGSPTVAPLSAPWTPAGPAAIQSLQYGFTSGRVTSLALDPADLSGNTVFVGTTGGGVWKSTNAAGPAISVTFTPLTDTLPVFSPSAGYTAAASLSVGALATLPNGIVLAGTGDPNDSSDSFYGSGLLRSTDSGLTWSLIQGAQDGTNGYHSFLGRGFAGFASSTSNPSLVVAALSQAAEGLLVNAGNAASEMGLYYSTDAGATWHMSTLLDGSTTLQAPSSTPGAQGHAATAVVWNPVRQVFLAAIRYHGYYQSADGITWTRLAAQPGTGLTLAACPTGADNISSSNCPIFRGALAVNTTTGDTFALTTSLSDQNQGLFQDVCGAVSSGSGCLAPSPVFARQISSTALESTSGQVAHLIPQADYNLALAALPATAAVGGSGPQDTLLLVGTADLFRCVVSGTTGACTLRNTTNTGNGCTTPALVAPAQHALLLSAAAAGPLLFLGNDGGLWRSIDGVNQQSTPCSQDDSTHFQNLNLSLGSLAEVVSFAQDPSNPAVLLAGLGALGTVSNARSDQTAWQQVSSGEGGTVSIDPTNSSLWYVSSAAGVSVASCPLGAACTSTDFSPSVTPAQLSGDPGLQDAPWLLDPGALDNLIAGTCRVWRGPAAAPSLWSSTDALSGPLFGPPNATCGSTNAFLASLAAGGPSAFGLSTRGSTVLYAGMAGALAGGGATAGGHLFSNTSANTAGPTTAWTDVSSSSVSNSTTRFNPGQFTLSSITADPHDSTGKTVYVTVQGFSGNGLSVSHVYGSTDAGAHWTDLSANLPNAPANALVVDPNDANTVYVALDTGVYATTSISTCSSANCWSLFGTALPNAPVTTLAAGAAIPTGDGRLGMLRAGTYGRGLWQIPLLTAATIQQPALTLSVSSLTFASQTVGSSSAAQTIVLTNTGAAPLVVSRIAVTSNNAAVGTQTIVTDFAVSFDSQSTCTSTPLAVGGTCFLSVTFNPSATGARSSTLTVYANVPGGQATVALAGTAATPPALVVTPTNLSFGSVNLLSTSAVQNISVANTGGVSLTLSAPALAGADFALTASTCGTTLAPSTACALSVTFRPTATGARTGSLGISGTPASGSSSQPLSTTVTLAGTGVAPPTDSLSGTALIFPNTTVGSPSGAQQIVLTNAGDTALTLIATSVSGADFAVTNSCGNSLAGHSACALSVVFTPHSVGALNATLSVSDAYRTQQIALSGTALAPPGVSLLPSGTLQFPSTGLGSTSAAQALTLTNNGGEPLQIASVTLSGDFLPTTTSNCGVKLYPATSCALNIAFSPTLAGLRTGSLTVVTNAPNSPHTVALQGTGIDFNLAPDSAATTLTVASGSIAVVPLLLSSPVELAGNTATLQCSGVPLNARCTLSPATVALGGSSLVTVTLATGVAPTASAAHRMETVWRSTTGEVVAATLAALLPWGLARLGKRSLPAVRLLTLLLVCGAVAGLSGCGGTPRQVPGSGDLSTAASTGSVSATPAGSYNITVSANSGGLTRSVAITLNVQ